MIRLTLLAAVGCLVGVEDPASPPDPKAAYDQMKAAAGRDAASQVDLALWCEAHGLERERLRHLAVAVLSDPSNAMARGLMGLVEYKGKWRRPDAVADAVKADVKRADLLAEYAGRRGRAPVKVEAQYKLALWCEEKGLNDEARAHLATVVRLDPNHAEAWRRLGYKKSGSRWVTDDEAARAKAEKESQQAADKAWHARLIRLRDGLGNVATRTEAERELATVADPRAVPTIWKVFVDPRGKHHATAVQLLGQVDAIEASRALATLAVLDKSAEVRRRATETLRRRDPREWADLLIAMLREKVKYEVKKVGGPGSPGELYVEGKKANLKRIYETPSMPFVPFLPGDTMATDADGRPVLVHHQFSYIAGNARFNPTGLGVAKYSSAPSNPAAVNRIASNLPKGFPNDVGSLERISFPFDPVAQAQWAQSAAQWAEMASGFVNNETLGFQRGVIVGFRRDEQIRVPVGQMMGEAQKAAASSADQLKRDVDALDTINDEVSSHNERIGSVLRAATGESLPLEPKPWRSWFVDQLGFKYKLMTPEDTPTVVESVAPSYQPRPVPVEVGRGPITFVRHSCFGRGTPVRTLAGPKTIETIEVGDLVLAQDARTGKLAYRPVVMAHHNPPSPTFEVALGGAPVVTSPSHRFWVAGRGWVMARDLKAGDPVRTLGGVARVAKIETGEVQPVFNLDVEGDADFFVGDAAALVHDNTLPDLKQQPFDAPRDVAAK